MENSVVRNLEYLRTLTPESIKSIQLEKLQKLISFHYTNNKKYKSMMEEKNVSPSDIKSLDDLIKLPIVKSVDITREPIENFHSVPEGSIARFLQTSGSTGTPKRIPLTNNEREQIFNQTAVFMYLSGIKGHYNENGISKGGSIYSLFPCGPWPSQFFSLDSCALIGPTITAGINLSMEWHAAEIKAHKPKYIITYPSFLSFFWQNMHDKIDFPSLKLESIVLAGEPFSEPFRTKMEELFEAPIYDLYGCAEIYGAASECSSLRKSGFLHWYAPNLIIEVLNQKTLEPICNSETGVMVITNLSKYAMPIVRYFMGDLISKSDEECPCGIKLPLISRIKGRYDHSFQYGAANIYPEQIYDAADNAGFGDKFQLRVEQGENSDKITIYVESEIQNKNLDKDLTDNFNKSLSKISQEYNQIINIIKFMPPAEVRTVKYGSLFNEQKTKLAKIIDLRR